MKTLRIPLVLSLITLLLFGVLYPLTMVGLGRLMPHRAAGLPIERDGVLVGFEAIGQPFHRAHYFWGRPSAVEYNAAATGGSNLAPTNPEFLALVQARIDTLVKYHPGLMPAQIPVELVTASGSGLDPHISRAGALLQVGRIAAARGMAVGTLRQLVEAHTEPPLWGALGPAGRVNVVRLNLALDALAVAPR
ncbi:K+-transporting ATPase ATPase C chain [Catalinimonas alkaloidigena]|uniref:Potassium-transporting ATPase KdpC subunit n=1 Tax=Catalinimonas alkaloidigena TaxID=1075417 RepID=A0A1G8YBX4_9BACT|nr:potassium-transporting ATPase subunit KdpC [Catalinimonas alkaloidigena]SDJ99904.1 K+-transporting ATPase ATPase C chain [Catalinimonas alkaloidigena]